VASRSTSISRGFAPRRDPKYRAAREYQRCARPGVTEPQAALEHEVDARFFLANDPNALSTALRLRRVILFGRGVDAISLAWRRSNAGGLCAETNSTNRESS